MKKLIYLIVFVIGLLFFGKPTFAAVRCETQYGGTQVCVTTGQLQVNKQIFCDPALSGNEDEQICKDTSDRFIDNMGLNFHKFAPGEEVRFRIRVKNVGDAAFSNVSVTDTPQSGFFQLSSGSLNFNLTNLNPGETRDTDIKFKVADTNLLPQNNVICVINTAQASAESNTDRDTSQLCLERKVLGVVKELPRTGPEAWFLTLFGGAVGLLAGAKLLRVGRMQKERHQSDYQMAQSMILRKGRGC